MVGAGCLVVNYCTGMWLCVALVCDCGVLMALSMCVRYLLFTFLTQCYFTMYGGYSVQHFQ
jgi:hypothetical protein